MNHRGQTSSRSPATARPPGPSSSTHQVAVRRVPAQVDRESAADARPGSAPAGHPARVTTFYDGSHWSYRVDDERDLGHRFGDRAPAVAAGRYLARSRGAVLVIKDEDGSVSEVLDYSETCSCHSAHGTSSRD
jgi:hypothetical protein